MAKVDNPNERILGNHNLIVTSNIEEPTTNTFTLKFVERYSLSSEMANKVSIFDITVDPNKSNALAVMESGASLPVEVTVQVPIGHQLLISGLKRGNPQAAEGWGVAGPILTNCVLEESVSGYLPNEVTVNIQDSPASIETGWQYGKVM